jgi:hypothetical protein
MTLYQILDTEGDEMGLIYTDAPGEVVQSTWKKVYLEDEPEDCAYIDWLVETLSAAWPKTERLFTEVILP